jgi:hypothetical protein
MTKADELEEDDELVEVPTPEQKSMDAARRVLRAGIWLIRNGYGRMALLPYIGGPGCWRCEFHPVGQPLNPLYRYSSASVARYLLDHGGGSIHSNPSAQRLALTIIERVPRDAAAACEGRASPETLAWLERLEATLARGFLPQAFHEYTDDFTVWQLISLTHGDGGAFEPMPGYIPPHLIDDAGRLVDDARRESSTCR